MNRLIGCLLSSVMTVPGMLSGCYRISNYAGDGQLVDNGASAATDRYVLNLGPIDLTRRGTKSFRIVNLPMANFVVGFEIVTLDNNVLDGNAASPTNAANPTVAIELTSLDEQVLFARQASLDAWTWAVRSGEYRAFVYGRDEPRTYFDATPNTVYTLTLKVIEPDLTQSKYTASLMAKSGGWK